MINIDIEMGLFREQTVNHTISQEHVTSVKGKQTQEPHPRTKGPGKYISDLSVGIKLEKQN